MYLILLNLMLYLTLAQAEREEGWKGGEPANWGHSHWLPILRTKDPLDTRIHTCPWLSAGGQAPGVFHRKEMGGALRAIPQVLGQRAGTAS